MARMVYMVTSGEYSDYRVNCVCETKELAEEVERRCKAGSIEEIDMVEAVEDYVLQPRYYVEIDGDGNELGRWSSEYSLFDGKYLEEDIVVSEPVGGCLFGSSYRSYDAALKAARDKLAEFKAQEAGI